MPITVNDERLRFQDWAGKGFTCVKEAPANVYFEFTIEFCPTIVINGEEELSDEEILSLPEKIGVFSFLNDEGEDIYKESDGSPLG
ncbi:MAG: hypothetical protein PHR44_04010 [Candidatus Omnitrophica bacterium]|nr:hypothetical protein [Candidatus Omnitrophota bacterium]